MAGVGDGLRQAGFDFGPRGALLSFRPAGGRQRRQIPAVLVGFYQFAAGRFGQLPLQVVILPVGFDELQHPGGNGSGGDDGQPAGVGRLRRLRFGPEGEADAVERLMDGLVGEVFRRQQGDGFVQTGDGGLCHQAGGVGAFRVVGVPQALLLGEQRL